MSDPLRHPPFFVSADDAPARQRILIEGLRLFAERGLSETTVRDIGAATGFTNPALYRHFKGKEALAEFLFERCYGRMVAVVGNALEDSPRGPEAMRAFVAAMLRLYAESPPAMLFVSDNLRRFWPTVSPTMRRFTLVSVVRKILSPKARPGADDDAEVRVATVIGAIQQVFRMLYLGGLEGPPDRWIAPLTKTLVTLIEK
mgnify:CR=1 FL=1